MGLVRSVTREVIKEIENKSREFYEFVLPPVDMHLSEDRLTVTIDMPGFDKKDIRLSLDENILSISAQKPQVEKDESIICSQRPNVIDKKIRLPVHVEKGQESAESAKLSQGILTIVIPLTKSGKDITID